MASNRARNRVLVGAWLQREGLTLAELAAKSRIPRQMLQAVKNGRDVRLSTMVKVLHGARALAQRNVPIDELFDFDGAEGTSDSANDTN